MPDCGANIARLALFAQQTGGAGANPCIKDHFNGIREIFKTNRETWRSARKPGDSRVNRETWQLCNRGVGMILNFVLAASFPFQLRKIGIERNVLLHVKSIILALNFVSL